jgi:hypothetical protein
MSERRRVESLTQSAVAEYAWSRSHPGRRGPARPGVNRYLLFAWARAEAAMDIVRAEERPSRSAADALRATLALVTLDLPPRAI